MDYHAPLKSGFVIEAVHQLVRSKVAHLEEDQIMYEMMQATIDMVQSGAIVQLANAVAAREAIPQTTFHSTFENF
jgi:histidine ammonia-lyase